MTIAPDVMAAYAARRAEAHDESSRFDFVREGSLATFWRQATPGTTYWRGFVPMLALPGQLRPITPESLDLSGDGLVLVGHEGAAIWQFLGDDGRSRIALQMRRQGVRTLMEVDDSYLRFGPAMQGLGSAWSKTHAEAERRSGYSVEMHRKVVPQMDGIICSTEKLAEEYADHNPNVYVCRNSIVPEDWDVERTESDTLRIGYYGSPSHAKDWPRVKKALKWAARQKDVEVVVLGFRPPAWSGKTTPWTDDLFAARQGLGQIDVGLAPLTRNPWADGKSDLKALEYAMGGVLPLLEDAPPYSPWKATGWPFMASTPDEWGDLIRDVVANRDDVKAQAAAAKAYVLAERTIDANIHSWREAVSGP